VRLARRLAWLALVVVSGCGLLRFAYSHADVFLRWQLGRYLDVHGAQSEELDARIASFVAWHRAHALPQYVGLLGEAGKRFERGLSREDLVWGYDSVQGQIREMVRAGATEIADLLDRLSAQQIEHLEHRFAEDNRKFARDHLRGSDEERRRRRAKRNIDRLEEWLGELSEAQVERVRRYSERAPFTGGYRDLERKRLQSELLSIVRDRQAKARLADWAATWERRREPEHAEAARALRMEYFAMLLDLESTMTPAQRESVKRRMRGLATDFQQLSRK
jgi:hypothetical protein